MKINKNELQKALELVKPGLSNKENIEQTTSFAFMNGHVVTYNDEISIQHPIKDLDLTGAIQAEELYNLLSKLKTEEISLTKEGNEIIIESGKAKAGLKIEDEIKLPLQEIEGKREWKELPENFIQALQFVLHTCSSDMSKPVLTCIHCNKDVIQASDGFKIAKFTLDNELSISEFLIPSRSAIAVIKIKPIKIALTNGWVHFKTKNNTVISCRIFEDNFPETSHLFKLKESVKLIFPKDLSEILDKVKVFTKADFITEEEAFIVIKDKKLKIRAESEQGWFEETMNMRYKGDGIEFFINPVFLQTVLKKSNECKLDNNKIFFEGENWKYLIMLMIKKEVE